MNTDCGDGVTPAATLEHGGSPERWAIRLAAPFTVRDVRASPRRVCLQSLCAINVAQVAIERAERQMTSFSGRLKKEAIGKPQGRPGPERLERRPDDIVVLKDESLVVQELLDGPGNLGDITVVD